MYPRLHEVCSSSALQSCIRDNTSFYNELLEELEAFDEFLATCTDHSELHWLGKLGLKLSNDYFFGISADVLCDMVEVWASIVWRQTFFRSCQNERQYELVLSLQSLHSKSLLLKTPEAFKALNDAVLALYTSKSIKDGHLPDHIIASGPAYPVLQTLCTLLASPGYEFAAWWQEISSELIVQCCKVLAFLFESTKDSFALKILIFEAGRFCHDRKQGEIARHSVGGLSLEVSPAFITNIKSLVGAIQRRARSELDNEKRADIALCSAYLSLHPNYLPLSTSSTRQCITNAEQTAIHNLHESGPSILDSSQLPMFLKSCWEQKHYHWCLSNSGLLLGGDYSINDIWRLFETGSIPCHEIRMNETRYDVVKASFSGRLITGKLEAGIDFRAVKVLQDFSHEFVANGTVLRDGIAAQSLFDQGYTLVLRGANHRSFYMNDINRMFEKWIGLPMDCNLYMTPPDSQGLPSHYDDHCVFVYQLKGLKLWTLGSITKYLPEYGKERTNPSQDAFINPTQITLQEGDVLYIPRGQAHFATTIGLGGPSFHVTFGVEMLPFFTWEGALHLCFHLRYLDEAALFDCETNTREISELRNLHVLMHLFLVMMKEEQHVAALRMASMFQLMGALKFGEEIENVTHQLIRHLAVMDNHQLVSEFSTISSLQSSDTKDHHGLQWLVDSFVSNKSSQLFWENFHLNLRPSSALVPGLYGTVAPQQLREFMCNQLGIICTENLFAKAWYHLVAIKGRYEHKIEGVSSFLRVFQSSSVVCKMK